MRKREREREETLEKRGGKLWEKEAQIFEKKRGSNKRGNLEKKRKYFQKLKGNSEEKWK